MYARGCDLVAKGPDHWGRRDDDGFSEACSVAERADVVVMCLGISASLEGEEGDAAGSESQGDRVHIELPDVQERLLRAVAATGKPIVLVLMSGSAVAAEWAEEQVPAILAAWYPGEEGGTAIADILFGDFNPAGRLPVTFVRSAEQLPPFSDYRMKGRTYRYLTEEPLYPFGYGLSYTSFAYRDPLLSRASIRPGESLRVKVDVENTGKVAGDEVTQLYVSDLAASVEVPRWSLKAFRRVRLEAGERRTLEFELTSRQLALIDNDGHCILEPGLFRVYLGGSQPDSRSRTLTGGSPLSVDLTVEGEPTQLEY